MSIVTLKLTKSHLKIENTEDDDLIQLYIDAAETWLGKYIGKPIADIDPVPADIKMVILKLVAFYHEQRNTVAFGTAMQIAPYGVTSIADSYREKWFGNVE